MIFSSKSLIFTVVGGIIGLVFYFIVGNLLGLVKIGIALAIAMAAIGFGIATLKMPESNNFDIMRKTGGENLDDIIIRALKFKARGKRIYLNVDTKEENKQ